MTGKDGTPQAATAEEGEVFDPRDAAALFEETTRQARSRFDLMPPILTLAAAVTVLVAYGAVWLSVRDQHPYSGPTGTALAVLYGVLAVWIVFVATILHRSLSGRSSRQRRLEAVVFGAIWISIYVFQGALYHVVPSQAVAFGVYPAVGPLIIGGAAAAGYEAAREKPAHASFAVATVVLGAFAAFAGPADVWGVVAIGGCALLLVGTAALLWERRVWHHG